MENNKSIDLIQIYRGIAAMMIVILHSWSNLTTYFDKDYSNILKFTSIGSFGVDFFFVLSGFIISYSYAGKKTEIKEYLANRIIRIFIPYLPLAIIFYIGYTYFPNLSNANNTHSLIATITLIPVGNSALGQAWSLMHEMIFYYIFVLALININKFYKFLLFWSIFTLFYLTFRFKTSITELDYFLHTFFSFYNFEFLLGYLCYYLISKFPSIKYSLIYSLFFMIIFFIIYFFTSNELVQKSIFSISCFWLIYFGFTRKHNRIKNTNIFMKIGFASYSIYLIHIPVIIILFRIIPKYNIYLSFIVVFIVSIFAGIIYAKYFENIFLKYFKNKINQYLIMK